MLLYEVITPRSLRRSVYGRKDRLRSSVVIPQPITKLSTNRSNFNDNGSNSDYTASSDRLTEKVVAGNRGWDGAVEILPSQRHIHTPQRDFDIKMFVYT